MTETNDHNKREAVRSWLTIVSIVFAGFVVISLLDANYQGLHINSFLYHVIRAVLILVAGLLVTNILKTRIQARNRTSFSPRQQTIVGFSARLILYFGLVLAVLAALGVGLSSFVFGGAFLTVIVGLAGQSMFANILGGIWLVLFHPFQIGDEISLVTWQYPVLMPSYPHEPLKPIYSGRVTDISLMYTSLIIEEGDTMVFPNGIIVQGAIANKSKTNYRRVRTRFEVPTEVDPKRLLAALEKRFDQMDRPPQFELVDLTLSGYSVRITLWSREREEQVRHRTLSLAWEALHDIGSISDINEMPH
jgi:small-conductance mechanosensitive channel